MKIIHDTKKLQALVNYTFNTWLKEQIATLGLPGTIQNDDTHHFQVFRSIAKLIVFFSCIYKTESCLIIII